MAQMLASMVKGLGGTAATGTGLMAGLGNFMKLDGMLGGGQQAWIQAPQFAQMNTNPNNTASGAQTFSAPPATSVSKTMSQESEWEKMVKAMQANIQNDLGTWLSR